ncbi:MAG: hypothetical protein RIB57_07785 [Pelagibacterium sp.]|uniref:hypothetical protein n=1 Tax=Pelagibacterium sp. TaxID=1967288 RepID=UPI0032EB7F98
MDIENEKKLSEGKQGTYPTQWWVCGYMNPPRLIFKRDPEWQFTREEWNDTFFFWTYPTGDDPAERVFKQFESQIDGLTFDKNKRAGLICEGRERWVNVPITRADIALAKERAA